MYIYVTNYEFIIRKSIMWAVDESASMTIGSKDGWPLLCSGMSADCCKL